MKDIVKLIGTAGIAVSLLFACSALASDPTCVGKRAPLDLCVQIKDETTCNNSYHQDANEHDLYIQCAWSSSNGCELTGPYCIPQ